MDEFDLIARYFLPLTQGRLEAGSLQNDAAIFQIPPGKELVITTDMLLSGVHFLPSQSPASIAKKALRTNLSDLTAMGSKPYCYQMALAMPEANESWLAEFCTGLAEDNKRYGVFLSGGDTTRSPQGLVVSITAFGLADAGKSITRSGARAGDRIIVSGTIGAAYCGLQLALNKIQAEADFCAQRYDYPEPPVDLASDAARYAHAALDISDGLLADLGHMTKASGLSAHIHLADIPVAPEVQSLLDQGLVNYDELLSGGDDYELIMAVPPENCAALFEAARQKSIQLQDIGEFFAGNPDVRVFNKDGSRYQVAKQGWRHFLKISIFAAKSL